MNLTTYVNSLCPNLSGHRAPLVDQHRLAVNDAFDLAVNLQLALGDDYDLLAQDREIGSEHGS
jgi:hypothetical protein